MDRKGNRYMLKDIVYIRVFATILVVIGHCEFYEGFSGFSAYMIPGINTNTVWNNVCAFIYSFHMALFFAISGYLISYSIRRKGVWSLSITNFLKRKTFRLLLPFVIITVFYSLPIKMITGRYSLDEIGIALFEQLIFAKNAHTWFLLALFWCMLFAAFIIIVYKRFTVLWPSSLLVIMVHLVGMPSFTHGYLMVLCYGKATEYLMPFLFGYLWNYFKFKNSIANKPFLVLFIAVVIFVLSNYFLLSNPQLAGSGLVGNKIHLFLRDITGISAFLCCLIVAGCFAQVKNNSIASELTNCLDKRSYEIYLYSEPLNYLILFYCVSIGGWFYGDSTLFVLRFVVTFFGALVLSYIIRINYGQK